MTVTKKKEKDIEDIQWFDVEYRIYFTSVTGYVIFSRVQCTSENIEKKKSFITSEMNSIINVKSIEFPVYYTFFGV